MKIAGVADLHFNGNRMALQSTLLDKALQIMCKEGVSWVLNAGDTFDHPTVFDAKGSFTQVSRAFLDPVERWGLPWISIAGNHDLLGADTSALDHLKGHRLVTVVENPEALVLRHVKHPHDVARICCLPWLDHLRRDRLNLTNEQIIAYLRDHQVNGAHMPSILLGHAEIEGAYGDSYRVILPGANFVFTRDDLESVGTDHIWFGHYHARQQYYLGSFVRNNFGEAENPDGFCIYDTETDQVDWFDVSGPRYHIVSAADAVEMLFSSRVVFGDCVRIQGASEILLTAVQSKLLEGVDLSVVPPVSEIPAARERITVDASADLVGAIQQWADHVKQTPPEGWEAQANDLAQLPDMSKRQLRPTALVSVVLHNIGPHTRTEVDFEEGWTVLCGPNGKGKSFVLEAIVAAIWGVWVHKERYMSTVCSEPTGFLEVGFKVGEKHWSICRTFLDGKPKGVMVYREGNLVAGAPNVIKKAQDYLAEHFGPNPDHHLGTWMLSQEAASDLTASGDSDRMAWIRDWLGLNRYQAFCIIARAKLKELQQPLSALNVQEQRLAQVEEEIQHITEAYNASSQIVAIKAQEVHSAQTSFEGHDRLYQEQKQNYVRGAERQENYKAIWAQIEQVENRLAALHIGAAEVNPNVMRTVEEAIVGLKDLRDFSAQEHRRVSSLEGRAGMLKNAGCKTQGYLPCVFIDDAKAAMLELQLNPLRGGWDESLAEELRRLERQLNDHREQNTRYQRDNALIKELNSRREDLRCDSRAQKPAVELKIPVESEEMIKARRELAEAQVAYDMALKKQAWDEGGLDTRKRDLVHLKDAVSQGATLRHDQAVWAFIERACGREGLPQLLIAQQIPALQARLDEINQTDLDCSFRMELTTLRELKDGRQAESFGILVDGLDVRSESGGRKALARLMLRAALQDEGGLLLADEPTAAQDAVNKEYVLCMLTRLSQRFKQVIVSTHDPLLAQRIPNRVDL